MPPESEWVIEAEGATAVLPKYPERGNDRPWAGKWEGHELSGKVEINPQQVGWTLKGGEKIHRQVPPGLGTWRDGLKKYFNKKEVFEVSMPNCSLLKPNSITLSSQNVRVFIALNKQLRSCCVSHLLKLPISRKGSILFEIRALAKITSYIKVRATCEHARICASTKEACS